MPTGKVKFESQISSADAAGYFETLAAGLREGELTLESGSDSVTMHVGEGVSFACNAKSSPEKGKAGVDFELRWRTAPDLRRSIVPQLHVLPGSQIAEQATFAEDFVDRKNLGAPANRAPADEAYQDGVRGHANTPSVGGTGQNAFAPASLSRAASNATRAAKSRAKTQRDTKVSTGARKSKARSR